jgi:hypothetical protein
VWQSIHHFHSAWLILFGVHLILGISYVPLLLHEIDISRRGPAEQEISGELQDRTHAFRAQRVVLLLIRLMVPLAAILQRSHNQR